MDSFVKVIRPYYYWQRDEYELSSLSSSTTTFFRVSNKKTSPALSYLCKLDAIECLSGEKYMGE